MKLLSTSFKIIILSWFLLNLGVWAHSPNDNPESNLNSLQPLVAQASLIVYGEVVNIQYSNSEPTREQPRGLPHTFVSYKVNEVLRGKAPGDLLTLRFPGGSDGRGRVYMNTEAPSFAQGQTDVLFVLGGKVEGCPLVHCLAGRYRIHEGRAYNAWGVPVVEAKESLVIGGRPRFELNIMDVPRPSFDQLIQNPATRELLEREMKAKSQTIDQVRARYEQEAPKSSKITYGSESKPTGTDEINEPKAVPIAKFGEPLTVEAFFDAVRHWSKLVGESTTEVVMADPKQPFRVDNPRLETLNVEPEQDPVISDELRDDKEAKEGSQ